jgi:hypothetical protein
MSLVAEELEPGLGLYCDNSHSDLAGWSLEGDCLVQFGADQSLAHRRAWAHDVDAFTTLFYRSEQVLLNLVITSKGDSYDAAGADFGQVNLATYDLGVFYQGTKMGDATFHLSLFFLGGVIVAVLLQIAKFSGGLNFLSDLDPSAGGEVVVLGLEAIERVLRELVSLGHYARLSALAPELGSEIDPSGCNAADHQTQSVLTVTQVATDNTALDIGPTRIRQV